MLVVTIAAFMGSTPRRPRSPAPQSSATIADPEGACRTLQGIAGSNARAMADGVSRSDARLAAGVGCLGKPAKVCEMMGRVIEAVYDNRFTPEQAEQHVAGNCGYFVQ